MKSIYDIPVIFLTIEDIVKDRTLCEKCGNVDHVGECNIEPASSKVDE